MQPASVREEDTIAGEDLNVENAIRGDQEEVGTGSNLVEPDSTSNQDQDGETLPNQFYHTGSQFIPTSDTFIPFQSEHRSSLTPHPEPPSYTNCPSIDQFTHNRFSTLVPHDSDFSNLDPICFVKPVQKSKRKVTRQEMVNKNNQPVPCLPDNPNRRLVPEDLQLLIQYQNPTRGIKFTSSQRMNTQMLLDDYVLKKKKGPYQMRGRRVINWRCVNDSCRFTVVTCEGDIQDSDRLHNHPSQPELYVKKQSRVKMRENMAQEVTIVQGEKDNSVTNAVMNVVSDTNPEVRNMIGSVDALKQAARRFNRKMYKKSDLNSLTTVTSTPTFNNSVEDIFASSSVVQNYEVVGESLANFQFSVDLDHVEHYTDISTRNIEIGEIVEVTVPIYESNEKITLKEYSENVRIVDETSCSYENVEVHCIEESCDQYSKDDLEELLESSPMNEDPLTDELNLEES